MLSQIKKFVNKREPEIILTAGIVLIALISFGFGRLSISSIENKPIIIETPSLTASIQQSVNETTEPREMAEGKIIGSVNSDKYHWPNCPHAQKISPENQIWFSSEKEAQAAGYKPCGNFEKYKPNQ